MFKTLTLIVALVAGSILMAIPQEAEATGGGLFARVARNRAAVRNVQRQRNVQKVVVQKQVVVDNHCAQQVVDVYGRSLVQRSIVVQPQRNVRIVEVPNVQVQRNLVVVRDQHGRVVDVKRQNVVEVQKNQVRRGNKIIIERNVIRGY